MIQEPRIFTSAHLSGLLVRAEKAEAERDAMRRAWDSLTAELRGSRFAALHDLADRHTPEG